MSTVRSKLNGIHFNEVLPMFHNTNIEGIESAIECGIKARETSKIKHVFFAYGKPYYIRDRGRPPKFNPPDVTSISFGLPSKNLKDIQKITPFDSGFFIVGSMEEAYSFNLGLVSSTREEWLDREVRMDNHIRSASAFVKHFWGENQNYLDNKCQNNVKKLLSHGGADVVSFLISKATTSDSSASKARQAHTVEIQCDPIPVCDLKNMTIFAPAPLKITYKCPFGKPSRHTTCGAKHADWTPYIVCRDPFPNGL